MVRCSSLFKLLLFGNPGLDSLQWNAYLYLGVYQGFCNNYRELILSLTEHLLPVIQQLVLLLQVPYWHLSLRWQKLSIFFSSKICCLHAFSHSTLSPSYSCFSPHPPHLFPEHSFLSQSLFPPYRSEVSGGEYRWQNSSQLAGIIYADSSL